MRAWKHFALATTVAAALLALAQSVSVYYRCSQFDNYLKQEVWRDRVNPQLRLSLLDKARSYSLPVTEDSIKITANGGVLRVDVDYTVPINLLVYRHEMKVHAIGAGLLRQ